MGLHVHHLKYKQQYSSFVHNLIVYLKSEHNRMKSELTHSPGLYNAARMLSMFNSG